MFGKIKQKAINYLKPKYNQSIIVESDNLPFSDASKPSFYSKNLEDFDKSDFRDCKYEVFRYKDPSNALEYSYVCVGEARFNDREPEKFILNITDAEMEKILTGEKFKPTIGIEFNKKIDLINQFDKDDVVGNVDYNSFVGGLINYEVKNGVAYDNISKDLKDKNVEFDSDFYLSFDGRDKKGKTFSEVVENEASNTTSGFKMPDFSVLKEKIVNVMEGSVTLKHDEKLIIEDYIPPFRDPSHSGFYSENIENLDFSDVKGYKYEVFKFRDSRVKGNEFSYVCVGEVEFAHKDSEKFIVEITDNEFKDLVLTRGGRYSFGDITSAEKYDLVNDFDKSETKGRDGYNNFVGNLVNYEVKNGALYSEAIRNFSDVGFYDSDVSSLYIRKDSEGKTILDAAKDVNSELYTGLLKEGFLSSSQVDNYKIAEELKENSALRLANYSFNSGLFVGEKTDIDKDVINYKYENVFMADTNQFFIKGVKEFEDPSRNQEFAEFVHSSKAMALLAKEVDIIHDKSFILLDKKLDILLDSGAADWKNIIASDLLSDINDFNKTKQAEILSQLDCNGETALDVAIKNRYLYEANDFMQKGALTKEEVEIKLEKERENINENVKDDGNEF